MKTLPSDCPECGEDVDVTIPYLYDRSSHTPHQPILTCSYLCHEITKAKIEGDDTADVLMLQPTLNA